MMRMADAAHELFGNDQNLAELLVFGYKIAAGGKGKQDSISQGGFELIEKPNKKDQEANFYGGGIGGGSSYIYDTYQTHVDKVDLDGGIEIGPQRHHPMLEVHPRLVEILRTVLGKNVHITRSALSCLILPSRRYSLTPARCVRGFVPQRVACQPVSSAI